MFGTQQIMFENVQYKSSWWLFLKIVVAIGISNGNLAGLLSE